MIESLRGPSASRTGAASDEGLVPRGPLGSERERTLMVRTYREASVAGSGADFGSGQCARLRERRDRFRLLYC